MEKVIQSLQMEEGLAHLQHFNTWMENLPYLQWYFQFNGRDYLFGGWQLPVIASALYAVSVFAGRAFMSSRKPFSGTFLKYCMGAHNLFLSMISMMMFGFTFGHMIWYFIIWRFSLFGIMCDQPCNILRGPIAFWVYVFLLSKYYEFLDTFFIVIKKQKLIFLHWYHHILTLMITWAGIEYGIGFQYMALITNTFVHIIMYWYFFLTSQGVKNIWWKPYITIMQMIQFVLNGFGITLWYFWHFKFGCCGDNVTVFWVLFSNVTFLFLFINNFMHNFYPHLLPAFMQDEKPAANKPASSAASSSSTTAAASSSPAAAKSANKGSPNKKKTN